MECSQNEGLIAYLRTLAGGGTLSIAGGTYYVSDYSDLPTPSEEVLGNIYYIDSSKKQYTCGVQGTNYFWIQSNYSESNIVVESLPTPQLGYLGRYAYDISTSTLYMCVSDEVSPTTDAQCFWKAF